MLVSLFDLGNSVKNAVIEKQIIAIGGGIGASG
jgi:hypothetical protein